MANVKASKKAVRQTIVRTERNRARKSRVKTFLKKVDEAILAGKKADANAALRIAESEYMKVVSTGIIKKETASRKISRLSAKIKTLAA
jgi:small subunit ribosomal protein S20